MLTAAAPPPAPVLRAMAEAGFQVTHVYGLTETYGPAVVCEWRDEWNALPMERAGRAQGAPGRAVSGAGRTHGRRRRDDGAGAARRRDAGRGLPPRQPGDEGLSQEPRGHRRVVRRRLVPQRRPRGLAPRRLHRAQGPLQGHHHLGRREHLVDRGRGRALRASRRSRPRRWSRSPSEKWGETPCAFVELKPGATRDRGGADAASVATASLTSSARATSSSSTLPKTSTGKIQKFVLRDRARET